MKKITLFLFLFAFGVISYAQSTINITTSGGSYTSEKWVSITTEIDGGGTQIWGQGDGTQCNGSGVINVNIDIAPGIYYVNCYDQYDDGWDGTLISVTAYGTVIGDNGGVSPDDGTDADSSYLCEGTPEELEASFEIIVPEAPSSAPDCATNFVNNGDPSCGNEDFTVSWDAVTGATGYLITAGTTSGGNDLADAVDQSGSSYTFTAVPGQSYYYTVTPYNGNGNAEGCEEQSVTLSTAICTPCDSAIAITPGIQQTGDTAGFEDSIDDSTCLGYYDGGNDAIFSYVAVEDNETLTVTASFGDAYSGIAMSLGCPTGDSTAYTCVGSSTYGTSQTFESDALIAGETYYIHISTYPFPQSTTFTLDTVVNAAPACLNPTALEAANITTDSADISWTSADSSFNIEVVDTTAGGTATGTATYSGVTSPYSLTGLSDNNSYVVYVQTDCGTDVSEWVSTGFTTLALPTVPDYTNDFSTFPGDLWSEAEGTIADGPSGSFAAWGSSGGYASINLYTTGDIDWLISPEFDLSAQAYFLNLDVSVTAYSGGGEISMGSDDLVSLVMTTDGTTWTILKQWSAADNLGNVFVAMDEIVLGTSSSARFALHADEGTVDDPEDYYFNIDNFSITSSSSLGINDLETTQFTYFPNPVNDQLTINAQTSVNDIAVLNMLGQVVLRQSPNSLNCVVDMAALRTGVYFVQVSIGNKTQTVRVLKQ
ncbi:MAG: T9SS type A sorting domain-containing protein [Flavobacteriaceae bacterium]